MRWEACTRSKEAAGKAAASRVPAKMGRPWRRSSVARLGGGDLDSLGLPSLIAKGREEGSRGAADVQGARLSVFAGRAMEDAPRGLVQAEIG